MSQISERAERLLHGDGDGDGQCNSGIEDSIDSILVPLE